jgi:hypothetical protein
VSDYRRFLATALAEQTLAYFGGPYVRTGSRRLLVQSAPARELAERPLAPARELAERPFAPAPGFYRFAVSGRQASVVGPAEPPDQSDLPAVRGYVIPRSGDAVYVAGEGGAAERLAIGPDDEPLPFGPVLARRYPGGELAFDAVEFESGVEDPVRRAYEDRGTLAEVKRAPAALRAAFGYAVLLRLAAEQAVPARPAEARPYLAALADRGEPAAREVLAMLRDARLHDARVRPRPAVEPDETPQWMLARDDALRRRGVVDFAEPAARRAANALYAAQAELRGLRRLGTDSFEVRYDLDGERFVSIVDATTLNVLDAGICLAEHDSDLTLESLPAVIREAIRTGRLHVTAY